MSQSLNSAQNKIVRITVVGDGHTGKTCLLIVYKDRKYNENYIPTVFDSYSMDISINKEDYKIFLQDTAGQEAYDKLRPLAYKETDVFIICYSVDSINAYENVRKKWSKEVKHFRPNSKIILVATKVDLRTQGDEPTLTHEQGLRLSRDIRADGFVECSSKTFYNVNEVFNCALKTCLLQNSKPEKRKTCVIL